MYMANISNFLFPNYAKLTISHTLETLMWRCAPQDVKKIYEITVFNKSSYKTKTNIKNKLQYVQAASHLRVWLNLSNSRMNK